MSAVAALFLVAALSAALFAAAGAPSLVVAHGFFALGVLPLMLAAITHFVPVLTRSGAPAKAMHALPAVAALAGALVVAAFAAVVPRHLLLLAALVVGATALSMIAWIVARARRALGTPHPGVRWYVVALGFLCLAMIAAFGVVLDPSRHGVWRALHVHLNLFGWIGLTALGTLPVLLPTALGRPDPDAARRLRTGLGPAAGAVLLISSGASAGWPLIGAAGGLLLGGVGLRLVLAWYRLYGVAALCRGPAAALVLAALALAALLAAGFAHGHGAVSSVGLLPGFIFGFLLPLVSGALAQLLPVWRFPGPRSPARDRYAIRLAGGAPVRALLFVVAGVLAIAGLPLAPWLAAAGVLWFIGRAIGRAAA